MQELLQKIFRETQITPVYNLSNLMWQKLERRMKIDIYTRLSVYSVVLFTSIVSFYNLIPIIYADMSNSWAGSLLSLIFSEGFGTLSVIWKDLVYGILESIPVVSLITVSFLLFVFILAFKKVVTYKRKLFNY